MKLSALTLLLCLSLVGSAQIAQNFSKLAVNKASIDTLENYYGNLGPNGVGTITLSNHLSNNFVTGMKFVVVIDSINQGGAPVHGAFVKVNGNLQPVYKGDILNLPVEFKLQSGKIGFKVLFTGTPTQSGANYYCGYDKMYTLSDDYGLGIAENTLNTCTVDGPQSAKNTPIKFVKIYPNPSRNTINFSTNLTMGGNLEIYGASGQKVLKQNIANISSFSIDVSKLAKGTYSYRLQSAGGKFYRGKLSIK